MHEGEMSRLGKWGLIVPAKTAEPSSSINRKHAAGMEIPDGVFSDQCLGSAPPLFPKTGRAAVSAPADLATATPTKRSITVSMTPSAAVPAFCLDEVGVVRGVLWITRQSGERRHRRGHESDWQGKRYSKK
jgi:hypothetical protein